MRYPTRTVGTSALVGSLVVSTGFVRLAAVTGHNNGAADLYMQVHASAAVPAGDAVPMFSVLAFKGLPYSLALPAVVDLDKCTIVPSSTLASYTAVAGTPVTIQAVVAG
jgi:hypothetical protein